MVCLRASPSLASLLLLVFVRRPLAGLPSSFRHDDDGFRRTTAWALVHHHKQRDKQVCYVVGALGAHRMPATRHLLFSPVGIWTDVGLLLGRRRGMRQLWCVRADLFFMPCNLGGGLVQGDQEMRVASTFCVDGERGMGLAPRYRGLHARGASA